MKAAKEVEALVQLANGVKSLGIAERGNRQADGDQRLNLG